MRGDAVLQRLSESLYLCRDTCNAYVITAGSHALVIDCGSGEAVRRNLRAMGVTDVERLLFTHHHRYCCQGAETLASKGAKVLVPEHERFLFEHAQEYLRHRPIYDSYNDRSTMNTRVSDLAVDGSLEDYSVVQWRGYEFRIVPTPGHTAGSITITASIDGRNCAFTGDLVGPEGRLQSLHDLEYSYGGCEGANLTAYSIRRLREGLLELLCPCHGDPIEEPDAALRKCFESARVWYRWKTGTDLPCMHGAVRITDHLVAFPGAACSWYALISDSGDALFIDHGAVDSIHFAMDASHREWWERFRYIDHGIEELRSRYGMKSVDLVLPTHYHDDHVGGIPYLQTYLGARVWCVDQMKEILEHPDRYCEMCLHREPIHVTRGLADGERFEWRGYSLQVCHFPGQTEYHQIVSLDVDGKTVLFTGDSIQRVGNHLASPVILRNYHRSPSHTECAQKLMSMRANIIAPGHGEPWVCRPDELASFRQHTQQLHTLFRHVLPDEERVRGINPYWVRIRPYDMHVGRGGTAKLVVRVTNTEEDACTAQVSMAGPKQIVFEPASRQVKLDPGETKEAKFELKVSQRYAGLPRVAVAADVTLGAKRFGQVAEAFVEIG